MTCSTGVLKKGKKYLIGVIPEWEDYCGPDLGFKLVRVGLYAPQLIKLKKANEKGNSRILGYKALKSIIYH